MTVRSVWPRCRSPWTRWACAGRRAADRAKHSRSASACSASAGTTTSAAVEPVRIPSATRSVVGGLGAEGLAEHLVDLAHGGAEPVGLAGEVAAHLVGVQVGLGEEVAGAGQGQVPAVAGGAQELLEHRQGAGRRPPASIQP